MKPLDAEVKQRLLAPFDAAEVRIRTQPFVAAYITARVAMTRLDEAVPWRWEFRLDGPGQLDASGVLHQDGRLRILASWDTGDGEDRPLWVEYADRGSAPPDLGKGQAKQAKHAVSDCFKRCAVHAGVGRYLYELQGVQAGRIPRASLEKAIAAVGYHGPWDERHHGAIGGIREADAEDEETGEPPRLSAAPATAPAAAAAPGAGSKAAREGEASVEAPAGAAGAQPAAAPSEADGPRVSGAWVGRMTGILESRGLAPTHAQFSAWLASQTSNGATELGAVLKSESAAVGRAIDARLKAIDAHRTASSDAAAAGETAAASADRPVAGADGRPKESPGGAATAGAPAAGAAPGSTGAFPDRDRYAALCVELGRAMGFKNKQTLKTYLDGAGLTPAATDELPAAIARLEARLAAETGAKAPGAAAKSDDPFDWDTAYETAVDGEGKRRAAA